MNPSRGDDAVVDLLDVVLRDGVVIDADVIVTVADVPLVGISVRAAVAGMATMARYGVFDDREADPPWRTWKRRPCGVRAPLVPDLRLQATR